MKLLIICSKQFYGKINDIKNELEKYGIEVFLPNCYLEPNTEAKMWLLGNKKHQEFKAKMYKQSEDTISLMDGVLVLNFDKEKDGMVIKNYIGGATFLEMYDAFRLNKKIYLYNDIPKGILYDEIQGFSPIIINGNLELLKQSLDVKNNMNNLEIIVKDNNIPGKRERMLKNKEAIRHIKKTMSDLKLKKNVAQYAYNLGLIDCLIKEDNLDELYEIIEKNRALLQDDNVLYYDNLRKNIEYLEKENSYYYQSINTDLRWSLYFEDIPNIFIYQGSDDMTNLYRHIIMPKITTNRVEDNFTIIYPPTEKQSVTYLRHFYNRTSFRYLEKLSQDYSLDLGDKDLGKVKILKKQ